MDGLRFRSLYEFALSVVAPLPGWRIIFLSSALAGAGVVGVAGVAHAEPGAIPRFAYVANAFDSSVSMYRVNAHTGMLRHMGHLHTAKFPVTTAVDPAQRFLYAATKVLDEVSAYRIDAQSGRLSLVEGSSVAAGRSPSAMVFHPSGRFAYLAARGGSILAFKVDPSLGLFTPLSDAAFAAGRRTRSLALHPTARFLYAANPYTNNISAYQVNAAAGALAPISGAPFSTGAKAQMLDGLPPMLDAPPEAGAVPFYVVIEPKGRFAYVANFAGNSISAYAIEPDTGALQPVPGSPFNTGLHPYAVVVDPAGRFAYVTCQESQAVAVHAINSSTGALSPMLGAPVATQGVEPTTLVFDPRGLFAYVSNYLSNTIAVFKRDIETGALSIQGQVQTRLGPAPLTLVSGDAPLTVVSRHALSVSRSAQRLTVYTVDAHGGFKEITHATTGDQPEAVTLVLEKYVYVANKASNNISAFVFDAANGRLQEAPGSPFATGKGPTALQADGNGWFLYVVNADANTLSVFSIEPGSGVLKQVPQSPVATGATPTSVMLDPGSRYAYVTNASANTISQYRYWERQTPLLDDLKRAGGLLRSGATPVATAIDPSGNFLYAANKTSGSISVAQIQDRSGILKELAGSPYPVGGAPVSLAVHPDGDMLYVLDAHGLSASRGSNLVNYKINRGDGTLTTAASRVSAGKNALSMILDAAGRYAYVVAADSKKILRYEINSSKQTLTAMEPIELAHPVNALVFDDVVE